MGRKKNLEKPERVLKAAYHLFLEEGYGGVSIRQIAARAGMAPSLVQHYFPKKEDILISVVNDLIRKAFIYLSDRVKGVDQHVLHGIFYRLFYEVFDHREKLFNIYVAVLENADLMCRGTQYSIENLGVATIEESLGLFVLNGTFSQLAMLRRRGLLALPTRDMVNLALYTYYSFERMDTREIGETLQFIDSFITDEFISGFLMSYEAEMADSQT